MCFGIQHNLRWYGVVLDYEALCCQNASNVVYELQTFANRLDPHEINHIFCVRAFNSFIS